MAIEDVQMMFDGQEGKLVFRQDSTKVQVTSCSSCHLLTTHLYIQCRMESTEELVSLLVCPLFREAPAAPFLHLLCMSALLEKMYAVFIQMLKKSGCVVKVCVIYNCFHYRLLRAEMMRSLEVQL